VLVNRLPGDIEREMDGSSRRPSLKRWTFAGSRALDELVGVTRSGSASMP
jgi:hypothetical protein